MSTKQWLLAWMGCLLLFCEIVLHAPAPAAAQMPDSLEDWSPQDFRWFYAFHMGAAFLVGLQAAAILVLAGTLLSYAPAAWRAWRRRWP